MPGPDNLLIQAAMDTLRRHAPFDAMDAESLGHLAAAVKLAYFPSGSVIVSPAGGIADALYIIQRGRVRRELAETPAGADVLEYAAGECFPLQAVLAKRPAAHVFTAAEDTFCYTLRSEVAAELARRSDAFRDFAVGRTSALLQRSYASIQALHHADLAGSPMRVLLRDLVRREAVTCGPGEPLQRALERMQRARVGSIVVVDEERLPIGIFTDRDLLRHSAGGTADPARPIAGLMTAAPRTLPASASAAEAALLMAAANIRHVPVIEHGRLAGVVSERDLFALQRMSMRSVADAVELAGDRAALAAAAAGIRRFVSGMIAQGLGAGHLTQLVASLNDRLARRILELECALHDLRGIAFCWLALGSEGRQEQTLATDQDNALVFSAGASASEARARLVPFAQAVNRTLDACGFPLCKGGVMAGNAAWCLSLSEWTDTLSGWVRDPTPGALLKCATFFDFRDLWGEASLASELRKHAVAATRDDQRFLRALAQSALESRPPDAMAAWLGIGRTLDLKLHGTRPFVDAARVLALASGLEETRTPHRLRLAGEKLQTPPGEIDAMVDSFHFLQMLRLRNPGAANPNVVSVEALNDVDRRILREAFRQARLLQRRLALDYRL